MITLLILLLLFGTLAIKISWLLLKASFWVVFLLFGVLIFSNLLLIGLVIAAIYGGYALYQRSQVQAYNNRH